jgi:hypothetical protein
MSEEPPVSVWSGTFRIWGIDLKCHVLSNGQRIIEQRSFIQFMESLANGAPIADEDDFEAFARWQRGAGR